MRLIKLDGGYNNGAYEFEEFYGDDVPPYFILSHTWGKPSDELSYRKLLEYQTSSLKETSERTRLLRKVKFCAEKSRVYSLAIYHIWIDTCCINKGDSNELSEAINSMFRWYQESYMCLVYLSDVSVEGLDVSQQQQAFKKSLWFTRGWTLQELIAPRWVRFYDVAGEFIGGRTGLATEINEITGIPFDLLQRNGFELPEHKLDLEPYSVEERLSWGKSRQTTRIEDKAYCMQGLFNVHMPIIYGEREKAFDRLREEIVKEQNRRIARREAAAQREEAARQEEAARREIAREERAARRERRALREAAEFDKVKTRERSARKAKEDRDYDSSVKVPRGTREVKAGAWDALRALFKR